MSHLFAGTSELYCMSALYIYPFLLFMLKNLVCKLASKLFFLSLCEPHMFSSPWKYLCYANYMFFAHFFADWLIFIVYKNISFV